MASTSDNLYVTFVDVDRDLLKIWGQRNRIGATYIERQLLQLMPEFNRTPSPNPSRIQKGMFCFAKYTDDNYYRARVISNVQGDTVYVLFVDYGNKNFINISNIRVQDGKEGDVLAKMAEQAEEYYLAKVAAPNFGWTKEILSEIRRDVSYEELKFKVITQVGDQKILEIQFHNEDFSSYLIKKHQARPISLQVQSQMILAYCSLVSSETKLNSPKEAITGTFSVSPPSASPAGGRPRISTQPPLLPNPNPFNFSQPPPPIVYPQKPSSVNFPKAPPHYPPVNAGNSTRVIENSSQPINPVYNQGPSNQFNPMYPVKGNQTPMLNSLNNVMIEALAKQIKQYITEDNAKVDQEKTPYHYVNSVLEVGNTYNVFISCIDDGPWSFSVRLLASESELEKLVSELSSCELVPIKPPIIVGHPCIGLTDYGSYCRGVIVSISHTAVKVYFVDFGDTEDLPVSSIFELPPKFFKTRVLSQKFSLSGLQKVAYSDDIKRFFSEVVQDKLLMLRVTSLEDDNLPTCELYLKNKNIKRILNEKIRELRSFTQEEFPKVGDSENVVVTWVISPEKFYVQLRKRDSEIGALKKELSEVSSEGQPITFQQLSVGLKCVCLYEADGNWYRVIVTAIESEEAITVFYVDYGNSETVKISLLRRIESSGLINQLNTQAIPCSLKGFESGSYTQETATKLESLILEKDFKMTVVSADKEYICVQLFENGIDVTTQLQQPASTLAVTVHTPPPQKSPQQSSEKSWRSPSSAEGSESYPHKFEKRNKYSDDERKENNFRGDKNRDRNTGGRSLNNVKSSKFTPRTSHPISNKRFEDEGNWREKKQDDGHSNWNDKFSGNKNSAPVRENTWNERRPMENQNMPGSRGFKMGRENDTRRERFDDRKKFDPNKGARSRMDTGKVMNFSKEGRRFERKDRSFEESSNWKKKSPGDRGDRFDKPFSDKSNADGPKSFRQPLKKENIAPPGSKFEDKVLEMGSSERGIVTFYFSPDEFYLQLLTDEEEFKSMMQEIQSYYCDKYSLKNPAQAGDIVIAQFSLDKILYRAEVIKPSPVTVRYVDYGNHELVALKDTWPVDQKFLKLPKQVVKCKLSNLQPVGPYWPPPGSSVDKFFECEEYRCKFLSFDNDIYEVAMESVENGKDIAKEIIAAGLGKPLTPKLDIPEVDYSLLTSLVLKVYISHVKSSSEFYAVLNPQAVQKIEEEIKAFVEVQNNIKPLEDSTVKPGTFCLSTSDNVSWHRSAILSCTGDKVFVQFCDRGDKLEVTADKVIGLPGSLEVFQPQAFVCNLYNVSDGLVDEVEFKNAVEKKNYLMSVISVNDNRLSVVLYNDKGHKLDLLKSIESPETIDPIGHLPIIHQNAQVKVCHIESPKEIYIQRVADCDDLNFMCEKLTEFCEGKTSLELEKETEGALVAGKSTTLKKWCRGRVMACFEDGFDIFFIDYGKTEKLSRDNVKQLDPSFYSPHAFAQKISLDVETTEENLQELNRKISELTLGKELLGCFVKKQNEYLGEFLLDGTRLTSQLKSFGVPSEGKDNFDEIFQKAESTDALGGSLRAFVSHIDNPKRFWVHKETNINNLHEFQDKLQKSCESLPKKQSARVGDVVGAIFSEMWYRARVENVDDSKLTVKFIDYGNTLDIDLSCETVKELTPDLIDVPTFATCYSLKGDWLDSATSKFEEIIVQHEDPVNVVILEEGDPAVVDLIQNGKSIAEKLREEKTEERELTTVYIAYARSPDDFYIQKDSSTDSLTLITERLLDAESFETVTSVQLNETYVAKFSEDEAWYRARVIKKDEEIEVIFIDYGNTSTVTEIKRLPEDLIEIPDIAENCCLASGDNCDVWSETACDKFSEYCDGSPLKMEVIVDRLKKPIVKLFIDDKSISEILEPLCDPDDRFEVYISHVSSPTEFYIQRVDDDQYKLISDKLENGSEYEELDDKSPGTLCQACFVDDGMWYRAKILRTLDEGCEVFFIDYGNVSVATELRKIPLEVKDIPPRASRCSLDLPEKNITDSVKEDFINLTSSDVVFRARIITPGEVNIVSLKHNGRILEKTLTSEHIPENCDFKDSVQNPTSSSLNEGTDDDKNSKKNSNYLNSSFEDDFRASSVQNETDEEKIAIADGGSEGFKSDDEKGMSEAGVASSVNATELIEEEEVHETEEETRDEEFLNVESEESNVSEETVDFENKTEDFKKEGKPNEDKIVPGSISRGEAEKDINDNSTALFPKLTHSEKLVPGSVSRGISVEMVKDTNSEEPLQEEMVNQSAGTPKVASKCDSLKSYVKKDPNDRLIPGCISAGISIHCNSPVEKIPPADKILSGSVNGSAAED